MSQHLSPKKKAILRKILQRKGRELANKLAAVLAGKDVRLIELANLRKGSGSRMSPEQKLRAYLDLVNERRAALDADDGSYGVCEMCAVQLSEPELDMMPWATRCRSCSSKEMVAGQTPA